MPLPLLLQLAAPPEAPATPAIVITGRDLPPPAGEAAFATVVLDDLDGPAEPIVENSIRRLGGVQQFRRSDSRSASPTSQGLTLRGLGGNASSRTLVLLDGVPLTDPFGGWINWTALERQRIGRATLTRGGGTGADGPGALAGTLSLESALPDGLEARAGGGSFGTADAAVLLGLSAGAAPCRWARTTRAPTASCPSWRRTGARPTFLRGTSAAGWRLASWPPSARASCRRAWRASATTARAGWPAWAAPRRAAT